MRFQFLKENQKKYNIKKACKILNISRSGYYDYLHRHKSKRSIDNEALSEIIADVLKKTKGDMVHAEFKKFYYNGILR